jgi:hypothetical protein
VTAIIGRSLPIRKLLLPNHCLTCVRAATRVAWLCFGMSIGPPVQCCGFESRANTLNDFRARTKNQNQKIKTKIRTPKHEAPPPPSVPPKVCVSRSSKCGMECRHTTLFSLSVELLDAATCESKVENTRSKRSAFEWISIPQ